MLPDQIEMNAYLRQRFIDLVVTQKRRFCYHALAARNEGWEIPAALVVEREPGLFLLDFTWGKNSSLAQIIVEEKNKQLGLSPDEVAAIITSSMVASKAQIKRNKG